MKKTALALILMLVIALSGCTPFTLEDSDIMCPPKATGEKAKLQKLIDKETSGSYILKYPKNGANRSSIITQNFDSDEDEEAIAFYSEKDDGNIHALFVDIIDDEYCTIDELIFEASNIDRVDFADLDGDKKNEIMIGYSTATTTQSTLDIFTYNEEITQYNTSCIYSSLVCGDFNLDHKDDVLLVSLYSGDIAAQAKLMVHAGDNTLSQLSSTELDSDILSLADIKYTQISYGTYGAVIDGINSNGDFTTQVVFFDPKQPSLINPLFSYSGYSSTRRSTQVCSADINKDELVEIPICSLFSFDQSEDINKVLRRIDWSNFDSNTFDLSVAQSSLLCTADGYILTMPSKWSDTVTGTYNSKERETIIYAYEYKNDKLALTDQLLTIKAFSVDTFSKDNSGFTEFLRTGSTVYTYRIGNAENFLSITGDEVSSLFSLVTQ